MGLIYQLLSKVCVQMFMLVSLKFGRKCDFGCEYEFASSVNYIHGSFAEKLIKT